MASLFVNYGKEYTSITTATGDYDSALADTLTDDGGNGTFDYGEAIDGSNYISGGEGVFVGHTTLAVDGTDITFVVVQSLSTAPDAFFYYVFADLPDGVSVQSANDAADSINFFNLETDPLPVCFAAGTLIAIPDGELTVETLQIGDVVLTADGRQAPVKWVGRQSVSTVFTPAERLMPVRFAANSLGNGLPYSDLIVTADHAMLVDGVLCNASALVNGATITRVPLAEMGERFTVYHIETEEHEIILANGAPAETFIDNVSRRVFDNYSEYEELYGDTPEMTELPYPRAMGARQIPSHIRAKLGLTKSA